MKNKASFLIKVLALTVIPTALFLVEFAMIVNFILGNTGHVQLLQFGDSLKLVGIEGEEGNVFSLAVLTVSFLCSIVFFVCMVLLVWDWRVYRNKKPN